MVPVKNQLTRVLILALPPISSMRLLNLPVPLFSQPCSGWSWILRRLQGSNETVRHLKRCLAHSMHHENICYFSFAMRKSKGVSGQLACCHVCPSWQLNKIRMLSTGWDHSCHYCLLVKFMSLATHSNLLRIGDVIIPISQVRKLRLRKVQRVTQDPIANM